MAASRSTYLHDLLRLLRGSFYASTDVDVDVVAGVHHVGVHVDGCVCGAGVLERDG
jgi:hypothetical protein